MHPAKETPLGRAGVKTWYIVLINAFVGCAIASTFSQFSMTITELSRASGLPASLLLVSDTVKSCGIVASMLCSGFFYNKFGAKAVFLYAMAATLIPQVLFPQVTGAWLLMLLKFAQGSALVFFPVFLVIILNWVKEERAGWSTAVFNGIFYSSGGLGGSFAGFVILRSSWEMSYYAMAGVQLLLGILWLLTIRERPPGASRAADAARREPAAPDGGRDANRGSLLLSPTTWLLAVSLFASTWTVQAVTVDMPVFSAFLGYDEAATATLLTAVTIAMILSCLTSGKVSDLAASRSEKKGQARLAVLVFGYVLTIIAVLLLVLIDASRFALFYAAVFLLTFGASWGLGVFYSILPELYDERAVPVVTGITGGVGDAGMPPAPLVVGVLFGIRGLWHVGWIVCGLLAVVSTLAAGILTVRLRSRTR